MKFLALAIIFAILCTIFVSADEDPCHLPPQQGKCRGSKTRYYFNPESKHCDTFIYGGCGGNENNFETLQACEQACADDVVVNNSIAQSKSEDDPCTYSEVPQGGRGLFDRYRFNMETKKCEHFYFGGGGGRGNIFRKLEDCEKTCAHHVN